MKQLKRDYRALYDKDVFYKDKDDEDEIGIDSSCLIEVFEFIFEKAIKKIKDGTRIDRKTKIDQIVIGENDPAITLDIDYYYKKHEREISIDVVPAFVMKYDEIKLPAYCKRASVKCPVYAVLKWEVEDFVWRICYSGYEKHIIDEARNVIKGQMILTAFRLMKKFNKLPLLKPSESCSEDDPVVSSYQLKNLMFYVLVWLLEKHPEIEVNGVQQVLPYFVVFLEESTRHGKLPHFFYSSSMSPFSKESMRYNLFERMASSKKDLERFCTNIRQLLGYGTYLDVKMADVRQEYVEEITHGTYIPSDSFRHAIRKQDCVAVTRKCNVRNQCFKLN